MARIFTIYFPFLEQVHHVMVSVRTTPFFTEYSLSNLPEELVAQLPGNKIISSDTEHFIFQNAGPGQPSLLMNAIITAVTEHLQAIKA